MFPARVDKYTIGFSCVFMKICLSTQPRIKPKLYFGSPETRSKFDDAQGNVIHTAVRHKRFEGNSNHSGTKAGECGSDQVDELSDPVEHLVNR